MIGQDHGVHLDGVDVVAVVAQHAGHLDLANFSQLFEGEAAGPSAVFVPEPISATEQVELFAQNTGEGRTHHGAGQGLLGDAGGPQVDVVGRFVVFHVSMDRFVTHYAKELFESVDAFEAAEFPP